MHRLAAIFAAVFVVAAVGAQELGEGKFEGKRAPAAAPIRFTEFPVPAREALDPELATRTALEGLLALQEGAGSDQWPYEGVYREDRGQLPIGYRVGGTAIACLALIAAPGYAEDEPRRAALERGLRFVLATLEHERMSLGFIGTYDVRGWGHIYALQLFLELQDHGLVPEALADELTEKTKGLVETLVGLAIPKSGGWNYSLRAGFGKERNRASTFMTAPALQVLFHAQARGHAVPELVLDEALDALDRARSEPGAYAYGASASTQNGVAEEELAMMDRVPSSAARATAVETTLLLAGRGDPARHRRAVQRFFDDWDALAVRKSQTGTHIPPYGIAPYYFLYGHLYAAQAIELLEDTTEREALRERMRAVLALSRDQDGTWNDRQFPRSAGYGTAMAILALNLPRVHRPIARLTGLGVKKG